jgi:hypothetical protein
MTCSHCYGDGTIEVGIRFGETRYEPCFCKPEERRTFLREQPPELSESREEIEAYFERCRRMEAGDVPRAYLAAEPPGETAADVQKRILEDDVRYLRSVAERGALRIDAVCAEIRNAELNKRAVEVLPQLQLIANYLRGPSE